MTLLSLQAGRALAALGVVVYHVPLILAQPEYGGTNVPPTLSQFGILGVNYFFVLSGFIILMAHFDDIDRPNRLRRYGWRRLMRIYPIYWLYLFLYLSASASGLGHPDFSWSIDQMANAFLLVEIFPPTAALPLKVAWTLFYEVQFYCIFAILLFNRWLGLGVISAWTIAIAINFIVPFSDAKLFSSWNIHFILGMSAYLAYRALPKQLALPALAVGVAGLLWFVFGQLARETGIKELRSSEMPLIASSFTLIVLGLAMAERDGRLAVPKAIRFLGDASYSIYLVHSAVISVAAAVLLRSGLLSGGAQLFWFVVIFAGASISGCLGYWLAERPILRMLRRPEGTAKSPGSDPTPAQ